MKMSRSQHPRYIRVKVEHYLLFTFSPPKISWAVSGIKDFCFHLHPVFYLIQPSSKQIICFDFRKKNSVLPIVFYIPCQHLSLSLNNIISNSNKRVEVAQLEISFNSFLQSFPIERNYPSFSAF